MATGVSSASTFQPGLRHGEKPATQCAIDMDVGESAGKPVEAVALRG
jgi:hypothetical protein